MCYNKILFMDKLRFHVISVCYEILFFGFFPQPYKNLKPFLDHRLHKNRKGARFNSFLFCLKV